jgi:hypothetical protein
LLAEGGKKQSNELKTLVVIPESTEKHSKQAWCFGEIEETP